MLVRFKQTNKRNAVGAFTLVEVLVALCVFGAMTGGLIYGYVQVNRMAEWSAMSLAAQSIASQGVEQKLCATFDQLGTNNTTYTYFGSNYSLDIPVTGSPIYVTNIVNVTQIRAVPILKQIRSDCVWQFPLTGDLFTNTVITVRATDQ
jgi:type II secretory pathway pseudopilin PulG